MLHTRQRTILTSILGALVVVALTAASGWQRQPPGSVALVDVTIIDVERGTRREHQTVLIRGDSILSVGPAGEVALPRGSRVVEGAGKFLIPGLWDMHVHLSMAGREALPVMLAAGVTGVRDMGGDPVVLAWRDSTASGTLVGPRIKAAGIIVESARWLQMVRDLTRPLGRQGLMSELDRRFGIATPEDAERAVDSLARMGADFVKIRNYPTAAAYFALVRAARRRGLPLAGHAPPPAFVAAVSDSGFASLEHVLLESRSGRLVEAFSQMSDEGRRDLFQRLARNGTAWDPTFVSGATRLLPDTALSRMIADSTGRTDPTLRFVPRTLRDEWRTQLSMRSVDPDTTTDWDAIQRASLGIARDGADAGVPILAGTDLGAPSIVPGFGLLSELELLVNEAHLTPREALAAATINAAATLKVRDKSGRIAPGYLADLVLLERDPLAQITAVRDIAAVVASGRVYDRATLERFAASGGR